MAIHTSYIHTSYILYIKYKYKKYFCILMEVSKVISGNRITLSEEVLNFLKIREGDFVKFGRENGKVSITAMTLVEK